MLRVKSSLKVIEKYVVSRFVEDELGLAVDSWPDEEIRQSSAIDAIAGKYAIEHTSIDSLPNQRRDSAWFIKVVKQLEDEFCCTLPFRLNLKLPYEGIQPGQDWSGITCALRNWVLNQSPSLPVGHHEIKNVPGVPFEFYAMKKSSNRIGLFFGRFLPNDETFPDRLREQLDRKIKKLSPYKGQNKTTILLVESDDIALMDEGTMWDGLRSAYPEGLPQGVDQIWFADTSIPENILFFRYDSSSM